MDIKAALATRTLPGIYVEKNDADRKKTLQSYAATYLKEEIQAEALTPNIEGFSRFFLVVTACAGTFLDLSKLASEAMVSRQTAVRFFEILEETLIFFAWKPLQKVNAEGGYHILDFSSSKWRAQRHIV